MRKKQIEISGLAHILQVCDDNGTLIKSKSQYAEKDGIKLNMDEKEYTDKDLADAFFDLPWSAQPIIEKFQEGTECYIKKYCEDNGASSASIHTVPVSTTIEIEVPEDEEFDPQKAALVTTVWVYPDEDTIKRMIIGLLYGDKVFPLYPIECKLEEGTNIWTYNVNKTDKDTDIEYTNETASEDQLKDASKLPVLIFRYQTLSYCYGPGEEFDVDEYPEYAELEGPGVVSAVNEEGNGMIFICADSLEYINCGEMVEELEADDVTDCEIELSATEKGYVLLNCSEMPDNDQLLKTISAIWDKSSEFTQHKSIFDKLIFRAISRDLENFAENHDYLLDNGKIYELPEGKFDEIIAGLSEEDQALNKDITPFGEYEEE